MTPGEVIEQIEDMYDRPGKKNMNLNRRQQYLDYLGKYEYDQLKPLLEQTIQESKYFPRIADFHSAARDLNYIIAREVPKPTPNCPKCEGTSWIYIRMITGKPAVQQVEAVVPCECMPRPKYDMREPEEVPW